MSCLSPLATTCLRSEMRMKELPANIWAITTSCQGRRKSSGSERGISISIHSREFSDPRLRPRTTFLIDVVTGKEATAMAMKLLSIYEMDMS